MSTLKIEQVTEGLLFPEGPVAMADGSVIVVEIGEYEHFATPDVITTNPCFGGADMRDAWITRSSTGKLYRCRWPRAGSKLAFNG